MTDMIKETEFGAVAQMMDPISKIVSAVRYTVFTDEVEYSFPKRS